MADILCLFSEERHALTVEELADTLGVSLATAYRYVAELVQVGLLAKSLGRYTLGPKIIELEYLVRYYDPVIKLGEDLLNGLANMTGCHVLLCHIYHERVVNVYHAPGRQELNLAFTLFARGRPLPLFRGSPSRAILPYLDRRRLQRLYLRHAQEPDVRALGADWPAFQQSMKAIRKRGYYTSHGELDDEAAGIAAPVFRGVRDVLGSLVLVYRNGSPPWMSEDALAQIVCENAREISRRIGEPGAQAANGRRAKTMP